MGYIFTFKDAIDYEKALNSAQGRFIMDLQKKFFLKMLKPEPEETAIDIGCGTGGNMVALIDSGLSVTGIDASPYMLDIARRKVKNRAPLHRGVAESLPFEDNSFNHACLITTLEFVDDADRALKEACRVAKDRLFIGYLNTYALAGAWRRVNGMFHSSIYNHAAFFSSGDLRRRIQRLMGDVPITCRTIGQFPAGKSEIIKKAESLEIVQRFPFGAFGGMVVTLVPRYKTRPLSLSLGTKRRESPAAG